MTDKTARLFLGLELNDEARRALTDVRRALQQRGIQAKLYDAPLYHLTLVFLGNTPLSSVPLLGRCMERAEGRAFELTLSSLGTFKNGSILWAGVEYSAALFAFQRRLSRELAGESFLFDEGEYRPHITLARQVKTPVPTVDVPRITFPITHATLFESTRVNDQLTYLPILRSAFH